MRRACGEDAAIVRATQGLPVYKSLGGCLALRPDGEVAIFDWLGEGVRVMGAEPDDAEWIGVAYIMAGLRITGLEGLVPERPDDAAICPECRGSGSGLEKLVESGVISEEEAAGLDEGGVFHCRCCGLGWKWWSGGLDEEGEGR